jgi:hypothetical protein
VNAEPGRNAELPATNKNRGTPAMKPKPPSKVDPIEREIERAFQPGAFIRDGACFSFVRGLEEVAATGHQEDERAAVQSRQGMAYHACRGAARSDSTSRIRKLLKKLVEQFKPKLTAARCLTFPYLRYGKVSSAPCDWRRFTMQ